MYGGATFGSLAPGQAVLEGEAPEATGAPVAATVTAQGAMSAEVNDS
jgi:hypothetical protein